MLTRIGWVAALSLLLGIGLSSQAQAKTFEQQIAGAVEQTARDIVDQDGWVTLSGLLAAKGGPGSAQVRVLVEAGPPVAPTGVCPADGVYLQQPRGVAGFITTFKYQSLLSGARGAPGVACVDLVTGNITVVAEGRITGGNGRFEGATGTWQVTAEAEPALFPIGLPLSGIGWRVTGTIVYDLD
jgi:hypothetical protein